MRKSRMEDLTGQRFGKLLVKNMIIPDCRQGRVKCQCDCDCGNTFITLSARLKNNETKSCGCFRKEKQSKTTWKGCGELSGSYFSSLRCSAKVRNIDFCITIQDMWDLYLKQNKKCALSGQSLVMKTYYSSDIIQTASLDRIDSLKGYTTDNIQWIHKDLNYMKGDLSMEQFIQNCNLISEYFKSK